jgi:ribosomal protein L11 methyltransferase
VAWLKASFTVETADAEALADALLDNGALSVDITDADAGTGQERPLFGEPGAEPHATWPHQRLSALFPEAAQVPDAIAAAFDCLGLECPPQQSVEQVAEQDWVRATQQQFAPIRIGSRLWIVPSWCTPPNPAAVNLILDPGLAFGTGAHPTTWQCLTWLEANLSPGASVLDYGCGSGVLAIAAKRLGAGTVVAVDIDPAALVAARANATTNAVDVLVAPTEKVPPGPYAVVMANILASPLQLLAPLLAGFTAAGGRVVLAGILTAQAAAVASAYAPWFDIAPAAETDGWTCLAGARKG